MDDFEKIEIPLSKGKLRIILILSVIFVAIGFWFIIYPPEINNTILDIPTLLWVSGVSSILFFGFCVYIVIKKLKDKSPGLIVDETGITDNSSGIAAGHIPWNDILAIRSIKFATQNFIIIIVRNPEKYIGLQTKPALKKAVQYNHKNFGSPISISEASLKCNFKELEDILNSALSKNKKSKK